MDAACRDHAAAHQSTDVLCQAPPLPAAFKSSPDRHWKLKNCIYSCFSSKKKLSAGKRGHGFSLIKFMPLLQGGKNSLPFQLSGTWQRKQKWLEGKVLMQLSVLDTSFVTWGQQQSTASPLFQHCRATVGKSALPQCYLLQSLSHQESGK